MRLFAENCFTDRTLHWGTLSWYGIHGFSFHKSGILNTPSPVWSRLFCSTILPYIMTLDIKKIDALFPSRTEKFMFDHTWWKLWANLFLLWAVPWCQTNVFGVILSYLHERYRYVLTNMFIMCYSSCILCLTVSLLILTMSAITLMPELDLSTQCH